MFDPLMAWPDNIGNGRVVDPPLAVVVDLGSLFAPGPGQSNKMGEVPMLQWVPSAAIRPTSAAT